MENADPSDERLWDECSDQMAIEVESAYNEVVLSPEEWREFQLALEAPPRARKVLDGKR